MLDSASPQASQLRRTRLDTRYYMTVADWHNVLNDAEQNRFRTNLESKQ